MKALLIRQQYLNRILNGKKIWEIRGSRTVLRGQIALIESKSGLVVGICELTDCIGPLTVRHLNENARKADIYPKAVKLPYGKRTFAWRLSRARRLPKPVPYKHPAGAVIWVNLDSKVARKVKKAFG